MVTLVVTGEASVWRTTGRAALGIVRLVAVVTATAAIASTSALPAAFAGRRAVEAVERQVFGEVPPFPGDIPSLAQTSFVVSRHGERIAELHDEVDRVPLTAAQIPDVVRHAVIATEDADFYGHRGVDHQSIVRAAVTNLQEGHIQEGASTITQQYVRNVLLSSEQTLERKITEAMWAIEIEERLSKEQILTRYLNSAYFGNGVYGVGTAARFYFSKPAAELTAAEAATLAGLIRAPEANDPIEHPERAVARRDIVLAQMRANGYLTAAEARRAERSPLALDIQPDPGPKEPFFVDYVKRVAFDPAIDLQPRLQEALGSTPRERQRAVFEGGLTIHTTVDLAMNAAAQETLRSYLDDPSEDPMGALITVKPDDGAVLAMAIGPEQYGICPDGSGDCAHTKLNPLVPGGGGRYGRQPGSAFKPIVVAAALAAGIPPSWETAAPSGEELEGCGYSEPYAPENYGQIDFGRVDMYEGILNSVNVWAAKLAREVGVLEVKEMARRLGIEHSGNLADFGPPDCSIGLGAANVYPLEMARVYATFANDGVRCDPFVVTEVVDRDGEVIYEHRPRCERVISQRVARRVTDILRGPSSSGTAPYVGRVLDRPVAGKTGTTQEWRDAWFLGFVPQYATAAWVGYAIPASMFGVEAAGITWPRVTGGSIPARMWADYMARILEGAPVEDLPAPGS